MFYDAGSVSVDAGRVRYWVKVIPVETLKGFPGRRSDDFAGSVAARAKDGYVPPLLKLSSARNVYKKHLEEFVAWAIEWELAANGGAHPTSMVTGRPRTS
jgi:hypothetical protein